MGLRCFVALPLPGPARRAIAGAIATLRAAGAPVKWVDPEQAHLTLKFLGDVEAAAVPALAAALASVTSPLPRQLALTTAGSFPGRGRPRVVWLGLAGDLDALHALATAIDQATAPLGFARELRPFRAHVTLGRVRDGALGDLARRIAELRVPGEPFPVAPFVLLQSTLTPAGPRYRQLSSGAADGAPPSP